MKTMHWQSLKIFNNNCYKPVKIENYTILNVFCISPGSLSLLCIVLKTFYFAISMCSLPLSPNAAPHTTCCLWWFRQTYKSVAILFVRHISVMCFLQEFQQDLWLKLHPFLSTIFFPYYLSSSWSAEAHPIWLWARGTLDW